MPSCAAACEDLAITSVQPISDEPTFMIAHSATIFERSLPNILDTTSTKGSALFCSSWLGTMPIITTHVLT